MATRWQRGVGKEVCGECAFHTVAKATTVSLTIHVTRCHGGRPVLHASRESLSSYLHRAGSPVVVRPYPIADRRFPFSLPLRASEWRGPGEALDSIGNRQRYGFHTVLFRTPFSFPFRWIWRKENGKDRGMGYHDATTTFSTIAIRLRVVPHARYRRQGVLFAAVPAFE